MLLVGGRVLSEFISRNSAPSNYSQRFSTIGYRWIGMSKVPLYTSNEGIYRESAKLVQIDFVREINETWEESANLVQIDFVREINETWEPPSSSQLITITEKLKETYKSGSHMHIYL
jgi:hypothetical protein